MPWSPRSSQPNRPGQVGFPARDRPPHPGRPRVPGPPADPRRVAPPADPGRVRGMTTNIARTSRANNDLRYMNPAERST